MPKICNSMNKNSMANTDKNRHKTPNICMYRINVNRKLRFFISSKIDLLWASSYVFLRFRMIWAIVKNRLVYANKINDVAEKSKAGVSIFSVIFELFFSGFKNFLGALFAIDCCRNNAACIACALATRIQAFDF